MCEPFDMLSEEAAAAATTAMEAVAAVQGDASEWLLDVADGAAGGGGAGFWRVPDAPLRVPVLPDAVAAQAPALGLRVVPRDEAAALVRDVANWRVVRVNAQRVPSRPKDTPVGVVEEGAEEEEDEEDEEDEEVYDRSCDACASNIVAHAPRFRREGCDVDVCAPCAATTDVGAALVLEHALSRHEPASALTSAFGSLYDWVPVLAGPTEPDPNEGDVADFVLVCANESSPAFRRCAVRTTDDHGRTGYATCGGDDIAAVLARAAKYEAVRTAWAIDNPDAHPGGSYTLFYALRAAAYPDAMAAFMAFKPAEAIYETQHAQTNLRLVMRELGQRTHYG